MKFNLNKALLVLFGLASFFGFSTTAQAAPMLPGIAIPAPLAENKISIAEMGVSYRFDQVGEQGKTLHSVPVQATYRMHNNGSAQTLEVAIPVFEINGQETQISAIFVNGKEESRANTKTVKPYGMVAEVRATVLLITFPEGGDAILDIRMNQPIDKYSFPFLLQTGEGWQGNINQGSIETILPYNASNVYVELRRIFDSTLMPQTFSGHSAIWKFNDLPMNEQSDVILTIADPEAVQYFERGNERWQTTKGDANSYLMMRNALLDMIPCNGVTVPVDAWWRQMYDTMTMGVISTYPEGQERLQKSLELWSDNWAIANGDDPKCTELKQKPDRYRSALSQFLTLPTDQLSSASLDTLKKHYEFLHALSAKTGNNSLAPHSSNEDPYGFEGLSETDKELLAKWDVRFSSNGATATGAQASANNEGDDNKSSFVSSTINSIKSIFPKLSQGAQIILFGLLALIVVIAIIILILRWKENDEPPALPSYKPSSTPFGGSPNLVKDADMNITKKNEPENILKETKKTEVEKSDDIKKEEPPKQGLDKSYQDKYHQSYTTKVNNVPVKDDTSKIGLIKPKTPVPNTTPSTKLPWDVTDQQKDTAPESMNNKKDDHEQKNNPPKPTVNI
ncbi:hypothetical protein KKG46_03285 [Patescibacteria group bacterium]|nr:hypothetical protein [Patescibacteria group bacterium]